MYDYQLKNGNIIQVRKLERKHPNLKIPEEFLLEAERLYNLGISLSEIEIILKVARGKTSSNGKFKIRERKRKSNKNPIYNLELSHQKNLTLFLNWIYSDCNI